jgi:aminoglycoside phosphotransferase (APT) family kinase protein
MDQDLTRWPSAVRQVVDDLVGSSLRSERLSGLSGREVRLVRGDLGSVVVKAGAHPRELAFYVDVAPSLAEHGVAVPDLLWHGTTQDRAWLVLLDWERAGFGGPAVDVAIALPGLPDRAESAAASAAYLAAHARRGSDPGPEEDDLARRLLVVKAWTAVELLAEERRHPELDATQDWLADALPVWVRSWR